MTEQADVRAYALRTLRLQFVLVRELAARYSHRRAMRDFPAAWRPLLEEMLHDPVIGADRRDSFFATVVDELCRCGQALHVVHLVGRLVRNLAIDELIIAGDCWDRGPRGDRVVDYLQQQPAVSFVWGNHDASWIGAALGNEALICTVLRISLRYRRLGQLDEGYSIPLTPLEHLARTVYGDDPATFFMPKADGMRPRELVARMQKAIVHPPVQARRAGHRPQPRLGAGPPPPAAPDRPRGRHGPHRRHRLPAPRHAIPHDRPGRPVRAQCRRAAVPRPPAIVVLGQRQAARARALSGRQRRDVPRPRRTPDLPRVRPVRRRWILPADAAGPRDVGGRAAAVRRHPAGRAAGRRRPRPGRPGSALVPVERPPQPAVRQGPHRHVRAGLRGRQAAAPRGEGPVLQADPRGPRSASGCWPSSASTPAAG